MKRMAIEEIAAGTGGAIKADNGYVPLSVSADSRTAYADDIFFPLVGEVHDAHKFIPGAYRNGCRVFVVSDEASVKWLLDKGDAGIVKVDDTNDALRRLAGYYINSMDVRKIAVTGSTGKTTTRDMIIRVCSTKYKTDGNKENFNNLFGVPLTILGFDKDVQVAILEMGMDRLGEIDALAEAVRPDVGIITNIGVSHIENLGSRDGIFQAKMEITNYFDRDNTLIVFKDDEYLNEIRTASDRKSKGYELVTTGFDKSAGYIISNIDTSGSRSVSFTLEHSGELQKFTLPIPGEHNVWNASLAVAAGGILGITMAEAAAALKKLKITDKRLNIIEKDGIKVIDDTYNASPESVNAALDVLMSFSGGRKVAILGDMAELGVNAEEFHKEVGMYAGKKAVDIVIAIGELSKNIYDNAVSRIGTERVRYFKTKNDFLKEISDIIRRGDIVLVKGSHSMRMDEIVEEIL